MSIVWTILGMVEFLVGGGVSGVGMGWDGRMGGFEPNILLLLV